MPLREDLQAGIVNGLPPCFIRDGTGGNEWLPVQHPQPGQAIPHEILPSEEMPHLLNPPAGWFVNANNDPTGNTLDNDAFNQLRPGGGIYYLFADYSAYGFRAGRITQLVKQKLSTGNGKISFAHPLGGPFNIPPAGGAFPPPLAGLAGIPTDGGFETVDPAAVKVRCTNPDDFMFSRGPVRRFVSEAGPDVIRGESSLPGGVSGVLGSPHYTDLLLAWLTNESYPLRLRQTDVRQGALSVRKFMPAE